MTHILKMNNSAGITEVNAEILFETIEDIGIEVTNNGEIDIFDILTSNLGYVNSEEQVTLRCNVYATPDVPRNKPIDRFWYFDIKVGEKTAIANIGLNPLHNNIVERVFNLLQLLEDEKS